MKLVKASALLATLLVLSAGASRIAMAQEALSPEPATFHNHVYYDLGTGVMYVPKGGAQTQLAGDVYNNTNPTAPANFGFSSTDLSSTFGDRVTTTGTGVLQENDFTIFNSGSSAGPLLTATVTISLFDAASNLPLGAYNANLNFGGGLTAGFFTIVTLTGLGGLNINLNTTDVLITQQIVNRTGTASRLGIASLDPPTIGSSSNQMYINSSTVGPAGYYNIGTSPNFLNANPGYRINISQPVPTQTQSWGSLKALYH